MVSVAIVGLLASLAAPNYEKLTDKAKIGRAKADMGGLKSAAMGLRAAHDTSLAVAMGSTCTACDFQGRNVGSPPVCGAAVASYAPRFMLLSYDRPPFDAWGQCYMLDENEGEFEASDCRYDSIISAGPDQRWSGSGDGDDVYDDDLILRLPFYYEHTGCHGSVDGQYGGHT